MGWRGLTKFGYQTFGENPSLTSGGYRYTARRLDPETLASSSQPSGLYYYRARTYSPTWGRFLQPDPSGYPAGANLYAYVNNDPLNRVDPFGLTPDSPRGSAGSSPVNQVVSTPAGAGSVAPPTVQEAQVFPLLEPPAILLDEPPAIVRPPVEVFPSNPTEPPGPGFEWRGAPGSTPGSPNGNWYNPNTGESLRPDLSHPEPIGPHYDYRAPSGDWYRWFPNGSIVPKA
ncbi:MAG: RHS repeat-associated core domain-containing protein [Roseiarcus sp.]